MLHSIDKAWFTGGQLDVARSSGMPELASSVLSFAAIGPRALFATSASEGDVAPGERLGN